MRSGSCIRILNFRAASIRQALNILTTERSIDLALLDLLLPDPVGLSGFLRLRDSHPKLPILMVSSVEDKQTIREALALGAVGYLSKSDLCYRIARTQSPGFWSGSVSGRRKGSL